MILARQTLLLFLAGWFSGPALAYSVLSHEAVVDALWEVKLRGYLLQRFLNATPEQLKHAHGCAYGGAILQDLGYYPRGSKEFSDLTHYVRTGDFIEALLREAHTLDEVAFAMGSLSHYVGDIDGHRNATNIAEPLLYPRLRKKFGDVVTYEDNPSGHLKTEFGFDVLHVARGNFAPEAYHDFIGFYVTKDLVARAFRDTYGLELADLFGNFDSAVESYRSVVSRIVPLATRVAWAQKKDEIMAAEPGVTHRRFVYIMKRSSYEHEWGKRRRGPSLFEEFLAILLKIIPPIGPLNALKFKLPNAEAERLFMASFNRAEYQYSMEVDAERAHTLDLPDKNYDVGDFTAAGVYKLNDDTVAFWLHKLAAKNFATATPEMRKTLLDFYSDLNAPIHTKKNPTAWRQTQSELAQLRQ